MTTTPRIPTANGRTWPPMLWPMLALLAVTAVIGWFDVDVRASAPFFDHASRTWIFSEAWPWRIVDHVGPIVGLVLAIASTGAFVLGFWIKRLERSQLATMFLGSVALLGPLLMVNGILKSCWGRPRPNAVVPLGGTVPYLPPWIPGATPEIHKSFPSGHASIGFFLIAPAFLFYRKRPRLFRRFLVWGLLYGTIMGLSRVLQGSHFVTDVLWSAGIVYLTCAAMYRAIDPETPLADRKPATDESIGSAPLASAERGDVAAVPTDTLPRAA